MQISSTGDGRSTGQFRQVHSSHVPGGPAARETGRIKPHSVDGVDIVGGQADRIQTLVSQLKDLPTSRDDVVDTVRHRLDQGEYSTREAAERTAARILGT